MVQRARAVAGTDVRSSGIGARFQFRCTCYADIVAEILSTLPGCSAMHTAPQRRNDVDHSTSNANGMNNSLRPLKAFPVILSALDRNPLFANENHFAARADSACSRHRHDSIDCT